MISILIPTNKAEVDEQLRDIMLTATSEYELHATCQPGTAAENRNRCLELAHGDTIIMLDDDITGFFPGWDEVLLKALVDDVSIVSARLLYEDGKRLPMMYDNDDYTPGAHPTHYNFVPTGCIAFKKNMIRFDEGYKEGYEDSDYCSQTKILFPYKHTVINNDCQLFHKGALTNHDEEKADRARYHAKWGMVHKPKTRKTSIVYYTSNQENPDFEGQIIEGIWRVNSELPIISVSQKPLDFGDNLCVGDVGCSYLNEYRQILLGAERATTEYVFTVESDCLYPPGFFDFEPGEAPIYKYSPHYVIWKWKGPYHPKDHSQACLCINRKYLITEIRKALQGLPEWSSTHIPFNIFMDKNQWETRKG